MKRIKTPELIASISVLSILTLVSVLLGCAQPAAPEAKPTLPKVVTMTTTEIG